jgi:N-acetyltransferase
MSDWIRTVTLQGNFVRLEPLSEDHIPGLTEIGAGRDFWNFMLYGDIKTESDMRKWVLDILERGKRGTDLPFVAVHLEIWAGGGRDALPEYHAQ